MGGGIGRRRRCAERRGPGAPGTGGERAVAPAALRHRILLNFEGQAEGLSTDDLQHFHEETESGDADAMQAYCMAFRRETVNTVGLMREAFRFYRNLDIDYCFQYKDKGYRIFADSTLPMVRHEHRLWTELEENQRDELSRKNFGRFLKRWGNRPDLLITTAGRGVGDHFFRH